MKYVVMSTTVQDNIHFPNNDAEICAAGGAGMYALAGMRVWEEDVGIVSGVGEDYAGLFGKWYHENAVTTRGLRVKDEYTPCTVKMASEKKPHCTENSIIKNWNRRQKIWQAL